MYRVEVGAGRAVLVLDAEGGSDLVPFTCDGWPYERVTCTTRRMPRELFDELVLERMRPRHRWDNQEAYGTRLRDVDGAEVRRVIEMARVAKRLQGPVGRDTVSAPERLGVMEGDRILQAAVVLFGR